MSYATIYALDSHTVADGLESGIKSDTDNRWSFSDV
jgi:hypothetical protein